MLRYSSPEPFGTGVYLLASIFDHSCCPNCTVVFQGREITVMATEEIPEGNISDVAGSQSHVFLRSSGAAAR